MKREEEEETPWIGVTLNHDTLGIEDELQEAKGRLHSRTRGLMLSFGEQVHQRHNQLNLVKSIQLIKEEKRED